MGYVPPPLDYEVLERMSPADRRRVIEQQQALLRLAIRSNQAIGAYAFFRLLVLLAIAAGAIAYHWWHLV